MTREHAELAIKLLPDPDTDDSALENLIVQLRRVLLELDVEAVEPMAASQVSAGSKGFDLETGALIVRFALHSDALRSVVLCVRRWAGRQRLCSVKLTLDSDSLVITGPHSATQERAVDLWIARHASQELSRPADDDHFTSRPAGAQHPATPNLASVMLGILDDSCKLPN